MSKESSICSDCQARKSENGHYRCEAVRTLENSRGKDITLIAKVILAAVENLTCTSPRGKRVITKAKELLAPGERKPRSMQVGRASKSELSAQASPARPAKKKSFTREQLATMVGLPEAWRQYFNDLLEHDIPLEGQVSPPVREVLRTFPNATKVINLLEYVRAAQDLRRDGTR